MEQIILVIHLLVAIAIIVLVLLQQGKGAEVGASFGSGASQTVFGSHGSKTFLSRFTAISVCLFFMTSVGLGLITLHRAKSQNIDALLKRAEQQEREQEKIPATKKPHHNADIPRLPQESQ